MYIIMHHIILFPHWQAKLDVGVVLLSTHRLLWRDQKNHVCHLQYLFVALNFFFSLLNVFLLKLNKNAWNLSFSVGMLYMYTLVTDHILWGAGSWHRKKVTALKPKRASDASVACYNNIWNYTPFINLYFKNKLLPF